VIRCQKEANKHFGERNTCLLRGKKRVNNEETKKNLIENKERKVGGLSEAKLL